MGGALRHGLATKDLEIPDVLGHETAVLFAGPGEELVVAEAGQRRVGRDGDDVVPPATRVIPSPRLDTALAVHN